LKEKIRLLIVIEGPTASGKTALSIAVAKYFDTVILSADSRQFYREMSIGTAKPSINEMGGVKHYFISSHSVKNELTAATFAIEAKKVLDKEFESHPVIVLTGGSGMYVDALCKGLDHVPVSLSHRAELNSEFSTSGLEPLLLELEVADPIHFSRIDKANPMRVIRALEVIRSTHKPYSSFLYHEKTNADFEVIRFRIEHPREHLYQRINLRVDHMMNEGLLEEVRSLFPFRDLNALKTVGYQELFDHIDGTTTLETAVDLIKQHSRNYAKRQLTWLRKNPDTHIISFSENQDMLRSLVDLLHQLGKIAEQLWNDY
jgi:tRNA dimethylallyltransferase